VCSGSAALPGTRGMTEAAAAGAGRRRQGGEGTAGRMIVLYSMHVRCFCGIGSKKNESGSLSHVTPPCCKCIHISLIFPAISSLLPWICSGAGRCRQTGGRVCNVLKRNSRTEPPRYLYLRVPRQGRAAPEAARLAAAAERSGAALRHPMPLPADGRRHHDSEVASHLTPNNSICPGELGVWKRSVHRSSATAEFRRRTGITPLRGRGSRKKRRRTYETRRVR